MDYNMQLGRQLPPLTAIKAFEAAGYEVFTVARGSSAAVAEPYEPPDAPVGTDGAGVVVPAVSITVTVMERTTVSALA